MSKNARTIRPLAAITALAMLLGGGIAAPAAAQGAIGRDALIDGARQCTQYLPRQERLRGIPTHLLAAIAATETGRYHEGVGLPLPWPWTINVAGKGYFFATKAEAILATKRFQDNGQKSIDVGCMQVNLRHHPEAFKSLDEAFTPETNITYAARFLRENFDELGSWKSAAAAYHSRTASLGQEYIGAVYRNWHHIIQRIAEAQGKKQQVRVAGVETELTPQDSAALLQTASAAIPKPKFTKREKSAQPTIGLAAHQTPRLKIITLSNRDRGKRENGVRVIRPESTPDSIRTASAFVPPLPEKSPEANLAGAREEKPSAASKGQFTPRPKYIEVGGVLKATTSAPASAPAFVFPD